MLFFFALDYVPACNILTDVHFRAFTPCWFFEYHPATDIHGYTVNLPVSICTTVYTSVHMSIGTSPSELLQDGYGDIEVQTIDVVGAFVGNGNEKDGIVKDVTVDPAGGLERDELAEIVAMDAKVTTSTRDDAEDNQDQIGHLRCDHRLFINEVSGDAPQSVNVTEFGSPSLFDNTAGPNPIFDDAGFLFIFNQVTAPQAFGNNGEGSGGKSNPTNMFRVNFRDEFGGGPIVDRFDDINYQMALNATNVVTLCKSEARIQLYYSVEEVEGAVNAFGRP
jgi:hypothetical protein